MIKRLKSIGITAVILLFISITIFYYWPRQYAFTLPGVMYQLGDENADYSVQTSIVVEGTLTRSLTGTRTFRGKLEIVDDSMYDDAGKVRLIDLTFHRDANHSAVIFYDNVGKFLKTSAYGHIYINNNFSKIAITRFVENETTSWSGSDGFMFAAPATTRDEAITISKQVIKLDGISW